MYTKCFENCLHILVINNTFRCTVAWWVRDWWKCDKCGQGTLWKTSQVNWRWKCWDRHSHSPRTSVRLCSPETDACKTSVNRILLCEKWKLRKMERAKRKCGVSTLISWLNLIILLPVGWFKEHCVRQKGKNTLGPKTGDWNCLCCYSTSNNARCVPLCCTSLSTIHWVDGHFEHLRVLVTDTAMSYIRQLFFVRSRWINCMYTYRDAAKWWATNQHCLLCGYMLKLWS